MSDNARRATRFDSPEYLEVWEFATNGETDRWIVYIGNDCFAMSDDANMPNGVCMYAGTTGDLFRPRLEGRQVFDLCELPRGTKIAIVRELHAQDRPVPSALLADPFSVPCLRPSSDYISTDFPSVS